MKKVLIIVDPQNDFITGTMAIPGAKEKMMKLAEYDLNQYDYIWITVDSHPENHKSFVENGGIWPKHCISHTNGYKMPEYLIEALQDVDFISCFEKGCNAKIEEYSIFESPDYCTQITNILKDLKHQGDVQVHICGLAGDYCVLETIKGLRKIVDDANIVILTDYIASIDGGVKLSNYLKGTRITCQ